MYRVHFFQSVENKEHDKIRSHYNPIYLCKYSCKAFECSSHNSICFNIKNKLYYECNVKHLMDSGSIDFLVLIFCRLCLD